MFEILFHKNLKSDYTRDKYFLTVQIQIFRRKGNMEKIEREKALTRATMKYC